MLSELLKKYMNQEPMDFGLYMERTIPISAVIKMMEEYHEAKLKEISNSNKCYCVKKHHYFGIIIVEDNLTKERAEVLCEKLNNESIDFDFTYEVHKQ